MKLTFAFIAFANLVTFLAAVDCSESISPNDFTSTTTVRPSYFQSSFQHSSTYQQPKNVGVNVHTKLTPPNAQPIVTFTTHNTRNTPGHVKVTVNHEQQSHHQVNYNYEKKVYQPAYPVKEEEEIVAAGNYPVPQVPVTQFSHSSVTNFQLGVRPEYRLQEVLKNYPRCTYKNNIDFTWDSSPYFNGEVERFYMPLTSKKAYNQFYKAATGLNLRVGEKLNDVCYIFDTNWTDLTTVVWTHGKVQENFQCRFLDNKVAVECVPKSQEGDSFLYFLTKTDNKTYMVGTTCWKTQEPEWIVSSIKQSLPYSLKQEILQHVQTNGFSRYDYTEANYDKCGDIDAIPGVVHAADIILDHKHQHSHTKPLIPIRQLVNTNFQSNNYFQPKPYASVVHNYPKCTPPKNVYDLTWSSAAYINKGVETFYIPLAKKSSVDNFQKTISGQVLRHTQNVNDVCLTIDVNWKDFSAVVTTFGGQHTEKFQCKFPMENKFIIECVPEDKSESFIAFVTKSDDSTFFVAYECWQEGEVDWTVYSNNKFVPYALKSDILRHVQELGFSQTDYVEPIYTNCARRSSYTPNPFVQQPVKQEFVQESNTGFQFSQVHVQQNRPHNVHSQLVNTNFQSNNYFQPKPYASVVHSYPKCTPPKNVYDLTWSSAAYINKGVETFYIPLAKKSSVDNFHKTISGQVLRHTQNVNDVCLTVDVNWKDFSAVVTTFGGQHTEKFQCKFPMENKFIIECVPEDKSESFIAFVTKSDNSTYFVAYECWQEGEVDWTAFSNNKYVPYTLKNDILRHVQELGFSQTDYVEPSYTNCARRSSYTPNPFVQQPVKQAFVQESNTGFQFSQVHGQQSRPHNVHSQTFQKPVTPVRQNYIKPKLETCQLPYSKRITWNTEEYRNQLNENLYVPMAHKDAYINYVKLASGKVLRTYDNMNDVCLRTMYNHYDASMKYFAYDSQESPVIKCGYERKDFWSWRCEEANGKSVQSTVTKSDDKTYFVVYNCQETGPTWAVFYKYNTKLPEQVKYDILDHLQSLGFSSEYKELNYNSCTYESEVEGSATALLPNCNPPNHLQVRTWESTSNFENIEYFEIAMADRKVPQLYNNILKRPFTYSSYRDSKSSCFRWRNNYKDNTTNLVGFNDNVSYNFDFRSSSVVNGWKAVYLPKEKNAAKFADYIIKSDNVGWMLGFQCWETADNFGLSIQNLEQN